MLNSLVLSILLSTPSLDVRVDGGAYLRFLREGRVVYGRTAKLSVLEGRLAHEKGYRLIPEILIPKNATGIEISEDGTVRSQVASQWIISGRLVVAKFASAEPVPESDGIAIASDRPTLLTLNVESGIKILAGENAALVSFRVVASESVERPTTPATKPPVKPDPKPETKPETRPQPQPIIPGTQAAKGLSYPGELRLNRDRVTLGDLFDFSAMPNGAELAATLLEAAPPLGQVRRIDRSRIEMKLRQSGIDIERNPITGPEAVVVTRASQMITHEVLAAEALQALRSTLGESFRVTDTTRDPGPLRVPAGTLRYSITQTRNSGNSATVTLEVLVDDVRHANRLFQYRIESLITLPKVGSTVAIIAQSGGVRIELQGRVLRVDAANQTVEVETPEKNRLTGRLVRENTIEVIL